MAVLIDSLDDLERRPMILLMLRTLVECNEHEVASVCPDLKTYYRICDRILDVMDSLDITRPDDYERSLLAFLLELPYRVSPKNAPRAVELGCRSVFRTQDVTRECDLIARLAVSSPFDGPARAEALWNHVVEDLERRPLLQRNEYGITVEELLGSYRELIKEHCSEERNNEA